MGRHGVRCCVATIELFDCLTRLLNHSPRISTSNSENLTLEVVKSLGVFSEYHGFVLIVDILPFENFIDLMQCVFHRDFVRKIRREHAPLRTDPIDDVGQRAFDSLGQYNVDRTSRLGNP